MTVNTKKKKNKPQKPTSLLIPGKLVSKDSLIMGILLQRDF